MPKKSSKPKQKRTNGEGTFYQRSDKTWVYQVTLGRRADGALNRKAFTGKTKAICLERKNMFFKEQERVEKLYLTQEDTDTSQNAIFSKAFSEWLNLYKAPPISKPTTFGSYVDILEVHLNPYFGEMSLSSITSDEVQSYYRLKQQDGARKDGKQGGLSAKTIRNHHILLKDFFTYANRRYKIGGNPTEGTKRPEVNTPARRVLSADEMTIFIQEVMRESQRTAILLGLFTGLRIGELLSLEIADLNLNNQTFRVRRNITRVRTDSVLFENPNIEVLNHNPENKTQLILQNTPKTKTSCRDIPMSDTLCDLLIKHIFFLKHSGWPNPRNLLFPSKVGTHIDPKSLAIRLRAVSKRCAIKNVNPHALRHTFATRLVDSKVPITVIKSILGHSSIQTTQLYLHGDTEVEREAITALTDYLDVAAVTSTPMIIETAKKKKFSDVQLPTFDQ